MIKKEDIYKLTLERAKELLIFHKWKKELHKNELQYHTEMMNLIQVHIIETKKLKDSDWKS